VKQAVRTV